MNLLAKFDKDQELCDELSEGKLFKLSQNLIITSIFYSAADVFLKPHHCAV